MSDMKLGVTGKELQVLAICYVVMLVFREKVWLSSQVVWAALDCICALG